LEYRAIRTRIRANSSSGVPPDQQYAAGNVFPKLVLSSVAAEAADQVHGFGKAGPSREKFFTAEKV
jgi:hypothetical protein